jgi:hypothetical protein
MRLYEPKPGRPGQRYFLEGKMNGSEFAIRCFENTIKNFNEMYNKLEKLEKAQEQIIIIMKMKKCLSKSF